MVGLYESQFNEPSSVKPLPALSMQNPTSNPETLTNAASESSEDEARKDPLIIDIPSEEEDSDDSFNQPIQNTRLLGEYFSANWRGSDGKIHQSSLNLDAILGHSDGKFIWGSHGFYASAVDVSLIGFELSAKFPYRDGWASAKIDLREHIRLKDSKLESFDIETDHM